MLRLSWPPAESRSLGRPLALQGCMHVLPCLALIMHAHRHNAKKMDSAAPSLRHTHLPHHLLGRVPNAEKIPAARASTLTIQFPWAHRC